MSSQIWCMLVAGFLLVGYHGLALKRSLADDSPQRNLLDYHTKKWLKVMLDTSDNSITACQMLRNIMGIHALLAGIAALGGAMVSMTLREDDNVSQIPIGVCCGLFSAAFIVYGLCCRIVHYLTFLTALFPQGPIREGYQTGDFPSKRAPKSGARSPADSAPPGHTPRSGSLVPGSVHETSTHSFGHHDGAFSFVLAEEKPFGPGEVEARAENILYRLSQLSITGGRLLIVALSVTFVIFGAYWFLFSSVMSSGCCYLMIDRGFGRPLLQLPQTLPTHIVVGGEARRQPAANTGEEGDDARPNVASAEMPTVKAAPART